MKPVTDRKRAFLFLTAGLLVASGLPARAVVPNQSTSPLAPKVFKLDELRAKRVLPIPEALAPAGAIAPVNAFRAVNGVAWEAMYDPATGTVALMQGKGIAWVPGTANQLRAQDLGVSSEDAAQNRVPSPIVGRMAHDLLQQVPGLVDAPASSFRLDMDASGPVLDYLYYVQLQWYYHDHIVEGAHVIFRMNHGNLVQVGQELVSSTIQGLDPDPRLSIEDAWAVAWSFIGGRRPGDVQDKGKISVIPVLRDAPSPDGRAAHRLAYRLVYTLGISNPGEIERWAVRVDAHSGEVVSFLDTNHYGRAHGGAYIQDRPAPEVDAPFPFVDIGGGLYADGGGNFSGNNATATLDGQYVTAVSLCGPISLTTATGDLDFGASAGTNCTTPGVGGAGNTHAARTQFVSLNAIKEHTRSYYPLNAFLARKITANVDQTGSCNASSGGDTLTFLRSGGGCANTGEIVGVSLHEYGHSWDANDGNGQAGENGSGETYGDATYAIFSHASCIGNGFLGGNCGGYGDPCLSCSGVRDIDWAKHNGNIPHTPHNFIDPSGQFNGCLTGGGYDGPCGREGHCESYVPSEAIWDIAARDLPAAGLDPETAWQLADRLWYVTAPTRDQTFTCDANYDSDGCAATNYYQTYVVADDCDGDLSNGTPHMQAIYNAFDRHDIACATPAVRTQPGCCPTLVAPALTATTGSNFVGLSWTAVPNANGYDVLRNFLGCGAGYTVIASVDANVTSYGDTEVVDGYTYYYRVQAKWSDVCAGPLSNCATALPNVVASAKYVGGSAALGADAGGDSDGILDNCETTNVGFQVVNDGNVALTTVRATITSLSPAATITTSMPVALGSLAQGATANGSFGITLSGGACGEMLEFRIDVTSDQQQGANKPTFAVFSVGPTGHDFGTPTSVTYDYELDDSGWSLEGGFTRDNTNSSTGTWAIHSPGGAGSRLACARALSPVFRPTGSSTLIMDVTWDIEDFNGEWFDRANVHAMNLTTGVHTLLTPTGAGATYNASGTSSGTLCHVNGQEGWAAASPGYPAFVTASFNLGALAGQTIQIEVNYNSDEGGNGAGLWFDNVRLANVSLQGCDTQGCEPAGAELVTGYGPRSSSPAIWTVWGHDYTTKVAETPAFGSGYGCNVGAGDIDADGLDELLNGPGPSPVNGPQVRAFRVVPLGAIAKVNFFAYGTLRYGVNVVGANWDGDVYSEMGTGAGPGAVFGPHVRGWNFDGATVSAMKGFSYFAYGTLKYGVNLTGGQLEVTPHAEVVTGPGPGNVFGPQGRGWDYQSGAITTMPINFFAYATGVFGLRVATADVDADGYSEIITGRGPNPVGANDSEVRGYNYDGTTLAQLFSVVAFPGSNAGALVAGGEFDSASLTEEIVVSTGGLGTSSSPLVRGYEWDGASGATQIAPDFNAYPTAGDTYGATLAIADVGVY